LIAGAAMPIESSHRSVRVGVTGLLVGVLCIFGIVQGWIDQFSELQQAMVWLLGAVTLGYGLVRLIPALFHPIFQGVGYLVCFIGVVFVVLSALNRELPSFAQVNRQTLSENITNRIFKTKELAADASDVVTEAVSDVEQALTSEPTRSAQAPQRQGDLVGSVVGITDGDTLTLLVGRSQYKIRLTEIDTPERGQAWGTRATQALSEKVFRQQVAVATTEQDRYGRWIGKVWLGQRDINRELVREGHAWVYRDYLEDRSLLNDEQAARDARLGLWSQPDPIAPWDYRRGDRSTALTSNDVVPLDPSSFACGKTYCREMTSCEEARYHLSQCGLTRLDGDGDGIPCEAICR